MSDEETYEHQFDEDAYGLTYLKWYRDIADALRYVTEEDREYYPHEMADAIRACKNARGSYTFAHADDFINPWIYTILPMVGNGLVYAQGSIVIIVINVGPYSLPEYFGPISGGSSVIINYN